jgi:hypothetical protein
VRKFTLGMALAVCLVATNFEAKASIIQFYYTTLGSPDVFSANYNTVTNTQTSTLAIGTSQNGADGIATGPTVGGLPTLFFTGEGDRTIYQITTTGTSVASSGPISGINNAFLLNANPSGSTLFTFDNVGHVATDAVTAGGLVTNGGGVAHSVTGADTNVSMMVWGMNPVGPVYYMTGSPSSNGDIGTIDISGATYVTTRLFTNVPTAEDAHFDPFTGLIVFWGQGEMATLNPLTNVLSAPVALPSGSCSSSGLTTGALDGAGHALIASCGQLDYIDYSASHNILTSAVVVTPGIAGKDLVIFQIPSAPAPEPSTILFALGGLALVAAKRLRRA